MKRLLSMLLATVLLVSLCAGCRSETPEMKEMKQWISNTKWHAISATDVNGSVVGAEEIENRMHGIYYEFKKNGKVISLMFNKELKGSWKAVSGDTVTITFGEAELTATRMEEKLEIEYLGSKFLMEK